MHQVGIQLRRNNRFTRFLLTLCRWLLACGLLALILHNLNTDKVVTLLQRMHPLFGLGMILINITLLLLMAYRWQLIAQQLSVKADYSQYLRATWLGALSGQIGPPLIFSEVARFKSLQKHGGNRQIISSQIIDRLSGQIILLLIAVLLLPFYVPLLAKSLPHAWLHQAAILIIVCATLLFIFVRLRKLEQFIDYRQVTLMLNPLLSFSHYMASLLIQLLLVCGFLLAALGIGELHQPLIFLALIPLLLIGVLLFPISVADWGTRETVAIFVLSYAGLGAENILAVSLIYGLAFSLTALLGMVFLLNRK